MKTARYGARKLLLCSALLILTLPHGGSADVGSLRVQLERLTVVSTQEPAGLLVRIARTTSVALPLKGPNPDVTIRGGGRVVALALVEERQKNPVAVVTGIVRRCDTPGCIGKSEHFTLTTHVTKEGRVRLPAGNYRLVLVSDGGRASATLHLRDVPGTREQLHLDRDVQAEVGRPQTHISTSPIGNLYSAGETDVFRETGVVFSALWLGGHPGVQSDMGTCIYRGHPPVAEAAAYSSSCYTLGAEGSRYATISSSLRFEQRLMSMTHPLRSGRWSHGLYYECSCVATLNDAISLWFSVPG